ncbi:MAG: hypothetical protein AB8H79_16230, partial [Myxococcota bacterium]
MRIVLAIVLALMGASSTMASPTPEPASPPAPTVGPAQPTELEVGAELFSREWVADDPRSAGGTGLGSDANAE